MNAIKTHLIILLLLCLCASTAGAQLQTRPFGIQNAPAERFEGEVSEEKDLSLTAQDEGLRLAALMKEQRKYRGRATTYGVLGGVSLGLGALLTTSGILAFSGNKHGNPAVDFGGIILTGAGGLFALGSVPLFIACHKQSVKAATISAFLKPLVTPGSPPSPGIGLSVTF